MTLDTCMTTATGKDESIPTMSVTSLGTTIPAGVPVLDSHWNGSVASCEGRAKLIVMFRSLELSTTGGGAVPFGPSSKAAAADRARSSMAAAMFVAASLELARLLS